MYFVRSRSSWNCKLKDDYIICCWCIFVTLASTCILAVVKCWQKLWRLNLTDLIVLPFSWRWIANNCRLQLYICYSGLAFCLFPLYPKSHTINIENNAKYRCCFIWRQSSSSRMRVINHNWSATKLRLHPQSVAEISCHSVLSGDRIQQCEKLSGSRHKDTDQCL